MAQRYVRRSLPWWTVVCAVLSVTPAFGQEAAGAGGAARYGFVDTERLLRETPGAAAADSLFQREFAQWRAQLDAMEDTLRRLITDYDRQQVTLTPEARDRRQQEIRQKQVRYQQLESDLTRRAEERRGELLSPIMRRILDAVEQVRRERNYVLVFTAQALVAADTTLDLTDEVLAKMKAQGQDAARRP